MGENLVSGHLAQGINIFMATMSSQDYHLGQSKEKKLQWAFSMPNFSQQEETIQHLMNTCPLAIKLWEKVEFRCQKKGRAPSDITNTIRNWTIDPHKSRLLNSLWKLILGLPFWTTWKERNRWIFKNQFTPLHGLWNNFCINLQETLTLQKWQEEDLPTILQENIIWENWNLGNSQISKHPSNNTHSNTASSQWRPPSQGIVQLNFDGASKGNPGKESHGGIFKFHNNTPLFIFYGTIGWDTNNLAELEGLWQGLCLA